MKARIKALFERYGRVGIAVWVTLIVISIVVSYVLSQAYREHLPQWLTDRLGADAGAALGTFAIYQALKIPRIILAIVLTPMVARWVGRAPSAEPAEAVPVLGNAPADP